MLTLSDTLLTTQTSLLERTAKATGSKPTTTEPAGVKSSPEILKISRRLSGVFRANNCLPFGDIANGRTWPDSNKVYEPAKTDVATNIWIAITSGNENQLRVTI
jgi:hypothetical protein